MQDGRRGRQPYVAFGGIGADQNSCMPMLLRRHLLYSVGFLLSVWERRQLDGLETRERLCASVAGRQPEAWRGVDADLVASAGSAERHITTQQRAGTAQVGDCVAFTSKPVLAIC